MNVRSKILFIATGLILLGALVYSALSDKIYFVNQQLNPDSVVYTGEEGGFDFPFYSSGTAVTVATVFHRVGQVQDGKLPVLFEVRPHQRYLLDTLHLEFYPLDPAAVQLGDSQAGTTIPYEFGRTDTDMSLILDFPELDEYAPPTISFTFWLDMSAMSSATPEKLTLDILFTIHEDSVFKLVRYSGKIAIQIDTRPDAG